jgi:hypothetical protein
VASISYTPPPTIRKFIRRFTPGELFFDWVIGPVGSGKTTGIFFKLVYMAAQQVRSPVDGVRRSRAVIVRNTAPQLRDTTLSSWNYWFKDGIAGEWHATAPMPMTFVLKFGDVECEVLFRALDTPDDVARVLSLDTTFVLIDEFVQLPKEIVDALAARCGRYPSSSDGGATNWGMWGSSNPGNEDDWWYDYLYEGLPANAHLYEQPSGFSAEAENVDNLPGKRAYYTSLAIGKSTHWIKQFIEVEWGYSLSGTPVVVTFNPQLHIASMPLMASTLLPLVAGFDPGLAGSALIFGQMDLNGRLTVVDELIQANMGAERIISDRLKPLIRAKYADFELIIAPDPAADARSNNDEKTIVDTLRDKKKGGFTVRFPDLNNQLSGRLEAIEHFTTRLTSTGAALQISPHCKHTIRALQGGWRYEIDRKGKTHDTPEKNSHSHTGDGFSYLCRYFQKGGSREARRKEQGFVPPRSTNIYAMR